VEVEGQGIDLEGHAGKYGQGEEDEGEAQSFHGSITVPNIGLGGQPLEAYFLYKAGIIPLI
jgi:hypothetical protein